jgi:hypothetical protein
MENRLESLVGEYVQNDGDAVRTRQGKALDLIVSNLQPRHFEHCSRQRLFYAANQAAQAVSVALATTYTGLCLSNPIQSNVVLVPVQVGIALSVAPAAIAPIGLIGGYSTTDVAHTAALIPGQGLLKGAAGVAKADSQATIPTPVWLQQLMGGFTAGAFPATSPALIDLQGAWVIPPGAFIAIGALTAVTGLFSINWLELPIRMIQ